jgi:hypothetical protein
MGMLFVARVTVLDNQVLRKEIHMSSQEPPFEQPGEEPHHEQQPGEERRIDHDPREQPQSDFAAPQTPPPGYPPQGYYAGPAVAPRRRRSPWLGCLIALIIILFLCAGSALVVTLLGFGLGIGGTFRNSATEPTQTFAVSESPALMLTNNAGSVNVNRGSANRIIVQAKKYASFGGNINNVQINYSHNGNTVNVTANSSGTVNFFNATSVDFTITVPPAVDLQINTNAGSINVNGVSGKMSLVSNAGSIGATQASLTGDSTFRTNAGSINFTGTIGTTGTYDFETNAGSIDMRLPGTDSFHLNATTDVGSINSSFPVTVNHSTTGATVNGDVGTAPQATLTLKTNAGSITLNRG